MSKITRISPISSLDCIVNRTIEATKYSSAVISNGHFIAEQILGYLSKVYFTDSTKRVLYGFSHSNKKLSYLFLQDIRAVSLISFSAKFKSS